MNKIIKILVIILLVLALIRLIIDVVWTLYIYSQVPPLP